MTQTNARTATNKRTTSTKTSPPPRFPSKETKTPKRQKKHIDKEQGKTKHEAPSSVNYRATQNKNNIGSTALERSVVYTTGGSKGPTLYKPHPGSRHNSQHNKHTKSPTRTTAAQPNQRILAKTQNQIDHYDETKKEYSWPIPHCKPEPKETTSRTTAGQAKAPTHP